MTEPRIYVAEPLSAGGFVNLQPEPFRHVVQVLRLGPGDRIVLFNGDGSDYEAELDQVDKRGARVRVGPGIAVARESPLRITLAQGISKGERMDFTIQKAVELGVTEIQPLLTDRCVVRLDAERWERKLEHWQGVVVAACEQCGRARIPPIKPVADLRDWLSEPDPATIKFVLAPTSDATLPVGGPRVQRATLLVGPEGGLSEHEIRLAELSGFTGLRLGPRVLRTETAGVVALSVVQALWGDLAGRTQ